MIRARFDAPVRFARPGSAGLSCELCCSNSRSPRRWVSHSPTAVGYPGAFRLQPRSAHSLSASPRADARDCAPRVHASLPFLPARSLSTSSAAPPVPTVPRNPRNASSRAAFSRPASAVGRCSRYWTTSPRSMGGGRSRGGFRSRGRSGPKAHPATGSNAPIPETACACARASAHRAHRAIRRDETRHGSPSGRESAQWETSRAPLAAFGCPNARARVGSFTCGDCEGRQASGSRSWRKAASCCARLPSEIGADHALSESRAGT